MFLLLCVFSCEKSGKSVHSKPAPITPYHQDFAQELFDRDLITVENHARLVKDIDDQKLISLLDFLPYCKHAAVIDLKEIEESTRNESELVGEITREVASIHPSLSYSNSQGTFGDFDGYMHTGGVSIEHNSKTYRDYASNADEIPNIFNRLLEADGSDDRVVVLYDYFSWNQVADLNKDYRKFGVILMKAEQLENLYFFTKQTKIFAALPFPELQAEYEKLPENLRCLPQAVPAGRHYSSLQAALKNPKNVEHLYLDSEDLTELGPEIQKLVHLRTLSLVNNQLTTLPPEIGFLTELRTLNLAENKITHLPKEIVQLRQLENLNLSRNAMPKLPMEICSLESLKFLSLDRNALEELPPQFGFLKELCQLNLANNRLSTLPITVGNFEKLHYLNLHANQIQKLPVEFYNMDKLRRLILSNNDLQALHPMISMFEQLEELILDGNRLEELPTALNGLITLTHLSLNRNKLSALPTRLNRLTNLKWFSFSANPTLPEGERKRVETWFKKQEERFYWCRILVYD